MSVNVLSIAGSDPSGGAGIQADLKTFGAHGVYGMAVITALTAQNTQGVRAVHMAPGAFLEEQLQALADDVHIDAVKIGMVGGTQGAEIIAKFVSAFDGVPVVLDPVMVAQSGDLLIDDAAKEAMKQALIPLASLVTPNIPEAQVLLNTDVNDLKRLAADFYGQYKIPVLIKGGHSEDSVVCDVFMDEQGEVVLEAPRIQTKNNHGTGCTLSSAIASNLARGDDLRHAVSAAKTYITQALISADKLSVGHGAGPVHHFHALWGEEG